MATVASPAALKSKPVAAATAVSASISKPSAAADMVSHRQQKPVVFTGHNAYMMSVARVCRDTLKFTDVCLVCPDGKVVAHRLILAAASSILRTAFLEVPANEAEGITEYTIIVPDVKKQVVASLVDFLYTGKLIISRSNSKDLQLLVKLLGIDPDGVRVEALDESIKKRMVQSQLTSSMGLTVKQQPAAAAPSTATSTAAAATSLASTPSAPSTPSNDLYEPPGLTVKPPPPPTQSDQTAAVASPRMTSLAGAPTTPTTNQDGEPVKTLPTRAAKRRPSQDGSHNGSGVGPSTASKEPKLNSSSAATAGNNVTIAPIGSGFGVGKNGGGGGGGKPASKRPSRPTRPTAKALKAASAASKAASSSSTSSAAAATAPPAAQQQQQQDLLSGYHDMSNVETWVCAICHLYDPATNDDGSSGDTTEWIGCDCNRWYHKLCTGLPIVDDSFSCKQVKLKCLPPSPPQKK